LSSKKKTADLPVFHSLCSGYNYYTLAEAGTCQVFGKDKSIIRHMKTDEYFYVTPFPNDKLYGLDIGYWVNLVRNPVDLKHFIWPVDVITLDGASNVAALVFPLRAVPAVNDLREALSDDMKTGVDKPWVRKLAADFIDAWCNFARAGYAYHEFSYGNMFYRRDNHEVMFDFSFSTQKCKGMFDAVNVKSGRITPDYADPYYYSENRNDLMDQASDFYSIAVILFKLFVGRLPYQGAVMEAEPNTTPQEHVNWLKIYHRNTYFIFDKEDTTNHIGGETGFARDEIFVERWEMLPERVRSMFCDVFGYSNVLRKNRDLLFYPPQQWQDALTAGGVIEP